MASRRDTEASGEPLLIQNSSGNPSFTQQGTIDWFALSRTTVSASIAVMARLSAAGVDPFTIAVGQLMISKFRLSVLGEHRLTTALSKLPSFSGYGDALWFGFGLKNTVRTLAMTAEGRNCVMLCASLAEVHSPEMSARILSGIVDLHKGPGSKGLTPSLEQWRSLVKLCSGVLSASPFAVTAEHMMGLAGHERVAMGSTNAKRIAGDPADIALALDAIARISNGSLLSVTLIGGSECGWLGAVAHWFFEIGVDFESAAGQSLERVSQPADGPRVLIIFNENPTSQQNLGVMVASETYVIRDLKDNIFEFSEVSNYDITGRVTWQEAIQQTFGEPARILLKQQAVFGSAIGSAARIFQGISKAEPDCGCTRLDLETWCGYHDSSFGQGYINSGVNLLVELAPLRHRMESAMKVSYVDAVGAYEAAMAKLAFLCSCTTCTEFTDHQPQFCLPVLAETVIRLIWHQSLCSMDVDLLPTRAGFERLYTGHLEFFNSDSYSSIEHRRQATESLLSHLCFEGVIDRAVHLYTGRGCGSRRFDQQKNSAAFVYGGIVFYLDILREITDHSCQAIKLHIVPGRIEVDSGRNFDILCDFPGLNRAEGRGCPSVKAEKLTDLTHQHFPVSDMMMKPKIDLRLILEENMTSLSTYYALNVPGAGYYTFGPLGMTNNIIHSTGLVDCTRRNCQKVKTKYPTMVRLTGNNQASIDATTIAGQDLVLRRVSSIPALRCMALLLENILTLQGLERSSSGPRDVDLDEEAHQRREVEVESNSGSGNGEEDTETDTTESTDILSILQSDECMPCCIQAAIRYREDKAIAQIVEA